MEHGRLQLTVDDLERGESVTKAIERILGQHAEDSSENEWLLSGTIDQVTNIHECAEMALSDEFGAEGYIDASDGRMAYTVRSESSPDSYEIEWTEESVIVAKCPSAEDALDYPNRTAELADAIISGQCRADNAAAWRQLLSKIAKAHETLEDLDPDDFS